MADFLSSHKKEPKSSDSIRLHPWVWVKSQDSFLSHKCNFGAEGYNVPKHTLLVPELPPGMDDPDAGIEDSRIAITRHVDQKEDVSHLGTDPLKTM